MSQKCRACGRFASNTEGAKCTKCTVSYHRACVNIPKDAKISSSWQCPECKAQTPRKDNTDDPVRGEGADYAPPPRNPVSGEDVSAEILREVRLHRAETRSLREGFEALRTVVGTFDVRLGDMESRLTDLEKKFSESNSEYCGNAEVDSLRSTVEQLKSELNDRDQEAFSNDLEITGIPEEQGENVGRLVSIIATKLGVTCEERDTVFVERVGIRRAPSSGVNANEQSAPAAVRPRPLVLRVARRQLRDSLLQAARVRRNLTTDGMGLAAAPTIFYLNERLSRFNKMLFFKARERARLRGWKYIWTRSGKIFVRRETGKASFRVRSEQDLEKIFGGEGN